MARLLGVVVMAGSSWWASARAAETTQDAFDLLRYRWVSSLVGDERFEATAPAVRERVEAQAREAQTLWSDMVKTPDADLWPALKTATNSAGLTATCTKLGVMAKAYATKGSPLYHDLALREDLLKGLRWVSTARYHAGTKSYDNWWDWQIGVPLALTNCLVCVYDEVPAAAMKDCTDAIESFTPVISSTGANGAWRAQIIMRRAILVRDAAKMEAVRDWMVKTMLPYFEPPADPAGARDGFSEGFYRDGSFFAHGRNPYNGGYGVSALASAVELVSLVAGTPWDVTGPDRGNVYEWIANSYEPLLFRGRLFDNTRGREISRGSVSAVWPPTGSVLLDIMIAAVDAVPEPCRQPLRRFIKATAAGGKVAALSVANTQRLAALTADRAVPIETQAALFRHYPLMARTVMRREGFGASVSMYSDSVYDYETLNNENLKGWHTADGWLQILDSDAGQFEDGYWPAVDWQRLPGTTVVRGSNKPSGRVNGSNWAGGTDLDGVNGATGFELRPYSGRIYDARTKEMIPATDGQTLAARKSWFMLGEEIFCVGSGIAADDAAPVETILENRRLDGAGGNVLTVDGQALPDGVDQHPVDARWLHLAGNVAGSSLGCVFTEPTRVQTLREIRTGTWKAINASCDEAPVQQRFMTLWLDHGVRPKGAAYAYVLLPGRSVADVARYAAAPSTTLLAATGAVHAVAQRGTGMIAANFWEDAPTTLALDGVRKLTVDHRACVLYRRQAGVTELAISDPTRANRTGIQAVLNVPFVRVLESGKYLSAEALPGGTRVTLDLSRVEADDRGHTFKIRLAN